jgi:hypothetical protein
VEGHRIVLGKLRIRNRLAMTEKGDDRQDSQWHYFRNHAFMLIYFGKFQLIHGPSNAVL